MTGSLILPLSHRRRFATKWSPKRRSRIRYATFFMTLMIFIAGTRLLGNRAEENKRKLLGSQDTPEYMSIGVVGGTGAYNTLSPVCVASISDGNCPGVQDSLPHGSLCEMLATNVYGCVKQYGTITPDNESSYSDSAETETTPENPEQSSESEVSDNPADTEATIAPKTPDQTIESEMPANTADTESTNVPENSAFFTMSTKAGDNELTNAPENPEQSNESEVSDNTAETNAPENSVDQLSDSISIDSASFSPDYCSLDTSLDVNLMYITCPRVSNANAGFAMDTACRSGERCVYACEPPYVSTDNGFSNEDCVPYLGRCGPYNPKTYKGGVYCDAGVAKLDNPTKPMCAMGLETAFITSTVPEVISSCQTVYPGNESPMIGIEVSSSSGRKAVTSFPQWYWQNTHNHFYVAIPGIPRNEACQWNYDPNSLNSGGVDTMPYIIGGGALVNNACDECAQHNLDFGENFDFSKTISSTPGFGIRVKNCNGENDCTEVICDATYTFDEGTQTLRAYWAKFNTIYGSDNVGCVIPQVAGRSWTEGNVRSKYTLFEYYPIDYAGKDTVAGSNFDADKCDRIKPQRAARHGTGSNPEIYVCEATMGAINLKSTLAYV